MKPHLERSKSNRARCRTCGEAIEKDVLRVVEGILSEDNEHVTPGYHHVTCMAEHNPQRATQIIASPETAPDLFEGALAMLDDAALVAQIREGRTRRATLRSLDDDPQTRSLLAELEAAPGDRGLLTVLADHLQLHGDDRGELITHDLAVSLDPHALARRRELTASLSPALEASERIGWGIGFIRKIEVRYHNVEPSRLQALLAHPSCRLVEVMVLSLVRYDNRPTPVLTPAMLPRSLRRLEIIGDLPAGTDLSVLPYLQHVSLDRAGVESLDALEGCGKRIPRLTIRSYELRREHRRRLEAVCDMLELDDGTPVEAPVVVARIEHANKPEWGLGTIVREVDDKIEVEFAAVGKKLFKRNAPFLRRV